MIKTLKDLMGKTATICESGGKYARDENSKNQIEVQKRQQSRMTLGSPPLVDTPLRL